MTRGLQHSFFNYRRVLNVDLALGPPSITQRGDFQQKAPITNQMSLPGTKVGLTEYVSVQ